MASSLGFAGLVIGAGVLIALVALVGGFAHTRRERLLTHQERMKALELGRDIPDDAATARMKVAWGADSAAEKADSRGQKADARTSNEITSGTLSRKCISTAVWVAFWGFLFAGQNNVTNSTPSAMAVSIAIAASAGAIGVTAVICGTILAMRTPAAGTQTRSLKKEFESDALDVVSRRG